MTKTGVAILGSGYWGPNYIRNFDNFKNAEIKWVCDIDPNKLKLVSDKYPRIKTTSNFDQVLSDPEVEAVVIVTPTQTHYSLAKKALKANKHVLVEKPITTRSEEAKELIELAKRQSRVLMVGHIFMFNQAVRKIKNYVDEGLLGDVQYLYASRTGLGPIRHDVNALWDLSPHDISILLYLLNQRPESVIAFGESYVQKDIEDVVFVILHFPNHIIAKLHVSWLDPIKIRQMTVVGTQKMLVFDDVSVTEPLKIFDKGVSYEKPFGSYGDFHLQVRDGDILIPKVQPNEPLKLECENFIDAIREGKKIETPGESGYDVVKILEAATESLKSGGRRITIRYDI